jgi:NAD+ diphosphatase
MDDLLRGFGTAFVSGSVERAAHARKGADAARMAPDARILLMRGGEPFVTASGPVEPCWLGPELWALLPRSAPWVFLTGGDGRPATFAVDAGPRFDLNQSVLQGLGVFRDLRSLLPVLTPLDAELVGLGKAMLEWHRTHGYCAQCGQPSKPVEGGWKRVCTDCGREHFPRTDPVVIMLVTDGEHCLLGREARWPPGMHSCLAGFVEPGETLAQACAREVFEEVGVRVHAVRYVADQPWPFPHSLMVGLLAQTADRTLNIDANEIEAARWFTRDEARAVMAGTLPGVWSPPGHAIAHALLRHWVEGG